MSVIWMEPDALNSELRVLREGCAMGETAGMQSRTGGRLRGMPYRRPHRTWAGQGTGVVCDLCSTLPGRVPACVNACPHDAAMRVNARAEFPA